MNDLQKKLLELLKEIDEICKKHNITYYIDGGSAIGAIRHRGFIPWDDDIDIVMTRDNYNKFYKVIQKEIRDDRKFECFENNKKYSMLYARYCDRTTTSILRTSMLDVFESGVFIDIFILDPFPNEDKKREKFIRLFRAYAEYVNPYYYDAIICENYNDVRKLRVLGFLLGRKRLHKYINKKIFSYKEEDCKDYFFRFDLFQFIYPKEFFKEPRYMMFGDFLAPTPTKIEDYLKIHYGNTWMYIPRGSNQEVHNVVTNLNVPYQKFKDDYFKFVPEDAINVYKKFHIKRLKNVKLKTEQDRLKYKMNAVKEEMSLNKKLDDINVKKLYQKNDYKKLNEVFKEYYEVQLNKNYLKNNITINIGENVYYAVSNLLNNGYYYKAKKLLKLYNDKYNDLKNLVDLVEKLNDYYYKNEFDKYYELINKYYDKYNYIIDFIEGKIKYLIKEKRYDDANKLIEESLKKYEKTDFLLKYKADILYKTNKKEAIKLYNSLLENIDNGILILEIKDLLGVEV